MSDIQMLGSASKLGFKEAGKLTPYLLCYKSREMTSDLHPELKSEDFVLNIMNGTQAKTLGKYGSDYLY